MKLQVERPVYNFPTILSYFLLSCFPIFSFFLLLNRPISSWPFHACCLPPPFISIFPFTALHSGPPTSQSANREARLFISKK